MKRRSLGVIGLMVLVTLAAVSPLAAAETENLIINGSFEDDLEGWGIAFAGEAKTVEIDTDVAAHGDKSVRVTKMKHGSSIGVGQRLEVTAGAKYRAEAMVRVANLDKDSNSPANMNDARLRVQFFFSGSPGQLIYSAQDQDTDGEWVSLVLEFSVPDGADMIALELLLTRANGEVWFDDVRLVKVSD